jgi:hypothetical protein
MILKNRPFAPQLPNEDAKIIYIFCDGAKREKQYFNAFNELDSRIKVEIYALKDGEDNSPKGLLELANNCFIETEEKPNPKYQLLEEDEVWFVVDTDKDKKESRKPQIKALRRECVLKNWHVVQSNPCFEVWLYYHFYEQKPNFEGMEFCKGWKQYIQKKKGGFDSKKHPILIQNAIQNAESNYGQDENDIPHIATTDVFRLSKSILPMIKDKLDSELAIKSVV